MRRTGTAIAPRPTGSAELLSGDFTVKLPALQKEKPRLHEEEKTGQHLPRISYAG